MLHDAIVFPWCYCYCYCCCCGGGGGGGVGCCALFVCLFVLFGDPGAVCCHLLSPLLSVLFRLQFAIAKLQLSSPVGWGGVGTLPGRQQGPVRSARSDTTLEIHHINPC